MPSIITAKIDVTKIEKARLFPGKNGAKYLDLVLIPSTNDRYGNSHMVVQGVSKEERAQGVRGPILGSAKELAGDGREAPRARNSRPTDRQLTNQTDNLDEDVPF